MKISSSAWATSVGTLIVAVLSCACSTTVTEPETTPVYADEIASGVEPISIEKTSVKHPEGIPVGPSPQAQDGGTGPADSSKESPVQEEKAAESDGEAPSPEGSAPGPEGAAEGEQGAPAAAKKTPSADKTAPAPAASSASTSEKSAAEKPAPAPQKKPPTAAEKK